MKPVPKGKPAVFYKSYFSIEDWFGPFEGWTSGTLWNGWACPYFEFDIAMKVVDAWNKISFPGEDYRARYDEERDEFYFCDGGLEEWNCFGHQIIESEAGPVKVYPIGSSYWTWSEENEA